MCVYHKYECVGCIYTVWHKALQWKRKLHLLTIQSIILRFATGNINSVSKKCLYNNKKETMSRTHQSFIAYNAIRKPLFIKVVKSEHNLKHWQKPRPLPQWDWLTRISSKRFWIYLNRPAMFHSTRFEMVFWNSFIAKRTFDRSKMKSGWFHITNESHKLFYGDRKYWIDHLYWVWTLNNRPMWFIYEYVLF